MGRESIALRQKSIFFFRHDAYSKHDVPTECTALFIPTGCTAFCIPTGCTAYFMPTGCTAYFMPTGCTAFCIPTGCTAFFIPKGCSTRTKAATCELKLSLCLTKHYAIKRYGGMDVQIRVFLTSALP
jgi:hypothetical protein